MNRPYVICHILSSLDGKINGPFMETESVREPGAKYGKYRADGGIREKLTPLFRLRK